ncbi:MFS transporter [Pandoraea nosoerga]|uniref:MFS transporter n=1 Tax=Pandoraea nosoerga TaxID=2508296 RepID=A0A5E4VLQ7_9BURK|nr:MULTISPECIES: MFS transporter [Pandoraea]MBN4666809.1 MFS transporter [Pandoraea nosoerga]MBN4677544.1 MFS transporter [Pandoraea nosoerga]MBN4682406.1 MFS transporter [Pandoraea nosoerga]MBN4746076.1 MFS transporter [Pandoraea nosoerga]VVE13297.1 MFS transporter [Pandoraea nosoerga]
MALKIKGLRWWMIGLLTLGTVMNYLARSSLAVAAPTVMKDLHITTQQYGWITGAFLVLYPIGAPLTGYLMDRIGLRLGFLLCGVTWSVVCMLHGLADGWIGLFVLRGLLGLAEASFIPAGMRAAAFWFPTKERALAAGIFNIGTSVGAILAPPLIAWSIMRYNWETAFVIAGGMGLVWGVLWLVFYRHPTDHPSLTQAESDYINEGRAVDAAADARKPSPLSILRQRNFWGIALPRLFADPVWGTIVFWMPLYLNQARGFDLKTIAATAWLPFVAADVGCLMGGTISLWLNKHFNITIFNGKRVVFTIGAIIMTAMCGVGFVKDPMMAIFLLCLGGFAHQTLSITVISMSADLFARNEVATATGLASLSAGIGNLLFTLVIGTFVTALGYAPFFVALGLGDLIGAVILWTVVKPVKPVIPGTVAPQSGARGDAHAAQAPYQAHQAH